MTELLIKELYEKLVRFKEALPTDSYRHNLDLCYTDNAMPTEKNLNAFIETLPVNLQHMAKDHLLIE